MKRFSWLRTVLIAFALTVMMAAPSFAVETLTGTLTYGGQSYTVSGYWKSNAKQTKVKFVTSSVVKKGWLQLGGYTYYLKGKGKRVTGVVYIGGRYYYFDNEGKQRTGLINTGDATYYFDPAEHGARAVGAGERVIDGNTYVFNALGQVLINAFDDSGNFYDAKGQRIHKATIKRLIQVALQPVGSTMYVWGGGWNQTDDGSGIESTTIGVPSRWAIFFRSQTKDYNYQNTRYQVHDGLDCAGYIGWALYNTFNIESGHGGYVMLAQTMASTYAGWGWGTYKAAASVNDYKCGDIMSYSGGHVYIVLGSCKDGSVVLLHASPKGVMISGTYSRSGSKDSEAIALAKKYMSECYPEWYAKYPDLERGTSYLTSYSQMRWTLGGTKSVMTDPDGYTSMGPEQILYDLFKK